MARLLGRAALSGMQSGAPAHAGPRLMLNVNLRLDRRLPLPGAVEVVEGQRVAPDAIIATAPNTPSRLQVIDLARAMEVQIRPEELRHTILVSPGQPVYIGQVIARAPRPGWFEREQLEAVSPVNGIVEFVSVGRAQVVIRTNSEVAEDRIALPVANFLSLDAAELPGAAVCRPGQAVEPGDLLARVSGFRPLGGEYRSPISGIVESISQLSGVITIVRERKPLVLHAALDGWVERVHPGYGAVVAATGHRVLGVLGLGGKSWGTLTCLAQTQVPDQPPDGAAGQILAVPGHVNEAFLSACRTAGVRGVIAASTGARGLESFLGRPLAAEIVTGPGTLSLSAEEAPGAGEGPAGGNRVISPMTVIITEGFGRLPMDGPTWQTLAGHAGRMVLLDGLTQIRAGVVRPSVMLPTGPVTPPAVLATTESGADLEPLAVGQRVRVVRHPHFGLYGTVVELPSGLTRLETEVEARVLTIQMDDGRRVKVAEANVEY